MAKTEGVKKGKGKKNKPPKGDAAEGKGALEESGGAVEAAESPERNIRALSVVGRLMSVNDPEHVEALLTSSQCIVWRHGEFSQRVRRAVAEWAQEPVSSILPTNTLGELAKGTPWNTGQQSRLVQAVNSNEVFAPPFPDTHMLPPSALLPASTTVAQWEKVVWRQQDPETPCFPFTD
jgi:hypothetical protein